MPKLAKNAGEEVRDDLIGEEVARLTPMISVSPLVMITCGVNRKVNTGNYENIDIYMAATIPLAGASIENLEALKEYVEHGADVAYALASKETGDRYVLIKEALRQGRQEEDAPA